MRVISINLPKAYVSALDEIKEKNKKTRSRLVQEILWKLIEEEYLLRTKLSNSDHDFKVITASLPDDLVEILDALTGGGLRSRSELIRTTIRDYLKKTLLDSSLDSKNTRVCEAIKALEIQVNNLGGNQ